MDFRICGLAYEPFAPLFEMSERELHEHGSVRRIAPPDSNYPCRVSLALPLARPDFRAEKRRGNLRSRQRGSAGAACAAAVAARL